MMKCTVCKETQATLGCSVCSLKCANKLAGDDHTLIAIRLKQAIEDAKGANVKGSRKKNDKRD